MGLKWQAKVKARKIKTDMNLGLANVAKVTHFIPERPRRVVRDWLIRLTTPKELAPYRKPLHGRIRKPTGINLYGFFRAENGLAQGAKMYARALESSFIPHTLVNTDFLDWLPQNDHSLDHAMSSHGKYGINLIHINGDQMEAASRPFPHRAFDYHYNIGVWLWELENLPVEFTDNLCYVDEIWAPSQFIADAVRKSTDKPVVVVPYGIETPVDVSFSPKEFGLPENAFLVLAMYDSNSYASRKNPEGAIQAFEKAFKGKHASAMLV